MSTLKATNLQHASATNPAIVLAADGSATANVSSINSGPLAGFRNAIINGDMRIDQRNAGASVSINALAEQYITDRFMVRGTQASKLTAQQSTLAPAGFSYSLLCTSSSAYSAISSDYFVIEQRIEGFNIAYLGFGAAGASSVTLSFWVRSSLTGTFGGAIGNSALDRTYPFAYTISAANTWEKKTVIISGDIAGTWLTTTGRGLSVFLGLGAGSSLSGTAGAWSSSTYVTATGATSVVGTNGATFYITGVQLEPGTVATPFERRPIGTELALCQRYYLHSAYRAPFRKYVSNVIRELVPFTVYMRVTPTLTKTAASAVNLGTDSTTATTYGLALDLQYTAGGTGVIDIPNYIVIASAEL